MLNTIPIKTGGTAKLAKPTNIIETMAHETDIEKGIREIQEKSRIVEGNNGELFYAGVNERTNEATDLAKSFHSMENKIFGSINKKEVNKAERVEGFDLSDITKKYSGINTVNLFANDKKLLISINDTLGKITVVDENGQQLGYFTIDHIIKYLSDAYDEKKQVLPELDMAIYGRAKDLIKLLLFKLDYNKKNKYSRIVLLDYNQSGLMADTELLVKLNDLLYKYLERDLNNALAAVDNKSNRAKIEKNIKKFVYLLLNYTLKLISIISDKLKEAGPDKDELKKELIKYSVSLVYRISTFVQEQLQIFNEHNKSIKEIMVYNIEIKDDIKDKLEKLIVQLQEQNKKK